MSGVSDKHAGMILTLAAAVTIETHFGVNHGHGSRSGHSGYRGGALI